MRFIVGYAADDQGQEALELGAWLAAQYDAVLTIAYVVPDDFPVATRVDARDSLPAEVRRQVEEWLARAGRWVGEHSDVRAETRLVPAASTARGLVGLAHQLDARLIVLGSSGGGKGQHFSIGTTSGQLLHSSPVPLALAPRGYVYDRDTPKGQVWCGYVGSEQSDDALLVAARIAHRVRVPLRLLTFEVETPPVRPTSADVEQIVTRGDEAEEVSAATREAIAELAGTGLDVAAVVARGKNVKKAFKALERQDDAADVLVIGSRRSGPLARFMLGSTASRILRRSPWPVIAVPTGAADLIDDTGGVRS